MLVLTVKDTQWQDLHKPNPLFSLLSDKSSAGSQSFFQHNVFSHHVSKSQRQHQPQPTPASANPSLSQPQSQSTPASASPCRLQCSQVFLEVVSLNSGGRSPTTADCGVSPITLHSSQKTILTRPLFPNLVLGHCPATNPPSVNAHYLHGTFLLYSGRVSFVHES